MPEIPEVNPGEVATAAEHNFAWRRAVQRYDDAATRDIENPTPEVGDVAYVVDVTELQLFDGAVWVTQAATKQNGSDYIDTDETRTLPTYNDLPTPGPTVSLSLPAGPVLVMWSASITNNTVGDFANVSFEVTGASNIPADNERSLSVQVAAANQRIDLGTSRIVNVLAGTNVFTLLYNAPTGGTASFRRRNLEVVQL